jgi:hypothetical protein
VVKANFDGSDFDATTCEFGNESGVGAGNGLRRELTFRRPRLIGSHRKDVPGSLKGEHPFDRPRQHSKLIGMERDRDRAGLLVSDDVDDRAVAIQDRDSGQRTLSHLVADT